MMRTATLKRLLYVDLHTKPMEQLSEAEVDLLYALSQDRDIRAFLDIASERKRRGGDD